MRKLCLLLFGLTLCIGIVGCGSKTEVPEDTKAAPTKPAEATEAQSPEL